MTPEERMDALVDHAISVRHHVDELRSSVRCSLTEARIMGYNESPGAATCDWGQDDDGNWGASCGSLHAFIDDGPSENNHKFCPYCGGRLEVA